MMAPGKKLQFMGAELGQSWEWRAAEELPWHLLQYPLHAGVKSLVGELNRLYVSEAALHELDFSPAGFQWIDCHDSDQSVISWLRRSRDGRHAVIVLNFTPVPRHNYRLGVPLVRDYMERINTDSAHYGGGDLGNGGRVTAEAKAWMGFPASVSLTLPPLAALVLLPA
jgi:1,4-alpha-glucan branching enzyme